ncbi:hypothetical protein ACLKA6_009881 [Drosophila palustris]
MWGLDARFGFGLKVLLSVRAMSLARSVKMQSIANRHQQLVPQVNFHQPPINWHLPTTTCCLTLLTQLQHVTPWQNHLAQVCGAKKDLPLTTTSST